MSPASELDRYEELVMALGNRESRGVRLIAFTPEFAQFVLADGSALVVLRHQLHDSERLDRMVLRVCEGLKQGTLYLVAAGGDQEARQVLEKRRPPRRLGKKVLIFSIDDSREVWSGPRSKAPRDLSAALDAIARPLNRGPAEFQQWLEERKLEARKLRSQVETYNRAMVERRPRATVGLIALTLVVYGLEWLFGGSDSVPTLVRMGALVGEGPQIAELWRLLSHSFLHAGAMHIGGNMLILWMLGSFLERLLGSWRLLTVWTLSILGGALASLLSPSTAAVTVGASGGGWGLMAAAGVLAMRPRGLIPAELARTLRRSIGQVLVINLFISFLPGVALSAHLGGGAVGAGMMVTGMATLGLVPTHQRATRGQGGRGAVFARLAGLLCGLALIFSLCLALDHGKPWLLTISPTWERHELGPRDLSIELPSNLPAPERHDSAEELLLNFGQPLADPLRVRIRVTEIKGPMGRPSHSPIRLYREFRKLKQRHLGDPLLDGMVRLGEPIEQEVGETFHFDEVFALPRGGRLWRHSRVVPSAVVVVSIIADERDGARKAPWAARIVGSLRTGHDPISSPQE